MDETLEEIARHTFAGRFHLIALLLDELSPRELKMIEHNVRELQHRIYAAQCRQGVQGF